MDIMKCDFNLIREQIFPLILMSFTGIFAAMPVLYIPAITDKIFLIEMLMWILLIGILCFDTLTDIRYMLIFNRANLILGILGIAHGLLPIMYENLPLFTLWNSIVGAFIGGGILLVLRLISRGGIGAGDVKLMTAGGIWLGAAGAVIAIEIAFLMGAVFGILYILYRKSMGILGNTGKLYIPFGPFAAFGIYCSYFYGSSIMYIYRSAVYG